jgi:hypothetical protein
LFTTPSLLISEGREFTTLTLDETVPLIFETVTVKVPVDTFVTVGLLTVVELNVPGPLQE